MYVKASEIELGKDSELSLSKMEQQAAYQSEDQQMIPSVLKN